MKTRNLNKSKAFTLVELMVVILIIAVLAAMIVPKLISRTEDAKDAKAVSDLRTLSKMLDTFRLDTGVYPTSEEGLEALRNSDIQGWKGPYLEKDVPTDPWNNEFIYEFPGPEGDDSFYLFSTGKDGVESDDDIWERGN